MPDIKTISFPPSSIERVSEDAQDVGKPHRENGLLTRAGMKFALKQGSTITMIAEFDKGKVYSYTREEDLPSEDQLKEFARRNHEHNEKLKVELNKR